MTRRRPSSPCRFCGEMFHGHRASQMFCSNACAQADRSKPHQRDAFCRFCGVAFISRNKDNGRGRHWTTCCSRECAGRLMFKGGPAASRRRRRYGMEPEEYAARLAAQGGGCALCGGTPDYPLYVDHDHATKENRGLLCARCNTAAGVFDALTWWEVLALWAYCHQDPTTPPRIAPPARNPETGA